MNTNTHTNQQDSQAGDELFKFIEMYWGTSREKAYEELKIVAERLATKRELYGRLHQVIELFQSGQLSAEAYSKLHSDITDRITTLKEKQL
jgi:hypothetical protein